MKKLRQRGSVLVEYLLLCASSIMMVGAAVAVLSDLYAKLGEQLTTLPLYPVVRPGWTSPARITTSPAEPVPIVGSEKKEAPMADPAAATLPPAPPPGGGLVLSDEAKHHALGRLFSIEPANITELLSMAKMYAQSELVPKDFYKKPQNIVIAITMGRSVGLSSMQSLLSIAVINGRPTIWGDAIPALLYYHQVLDPDFGNGGILERPPDEAWATKCGECQIKRKGWSQPIVRRFTYQEAIDAKLIERSKGGAEAKGVGPWITYPGRMLQMRARSWAARDACPDIMKGLMAREEAEDIVDAVTGQPVSSSIRAPKTMIDVKELDKFTAETASAPSSPAAGEITGPRSTARPESGAAAAAAAVPSSARTWSGQLDKMTQQATKNPAVKKYFVTAKDQTKFQTIKSELKEKAAIAISTGEIVTVTYEETQWGKELINVVPKDQPPAEGELPEEPREPGQEG